MTASWLHLSPWSALVASEIPNLFWSLSCSHSPDHSENEHFNINLKNVQISNGLWIQAPTVSNSFIFRIQISANCCSKSCQLILNLNQKLKDSFGRRVRLKFHPYLKIQKKTSLFSRLLVTYLPSNIVGVISIVMRLAIAIISLCKLKKGTSNKGASKREIPFGMILRY